MHLLLKRAALFACLCSPTAGLYAQSSNDNLPLSNSLSLLSPSAVRGTVNPNYGISSVVRYHAGSSDYEPKLSSIGSVIPLTYNAQVGNIINVYTFQKRDASERIIGLSSVYFPMFERVLAQYGVPSDLKYLSIPESALNTYAVSRSGAVGLWQLMPATARELGLTINEHCDERRDPMLSTHAAARYLRMLYERYGDWTLSIAAYNCGPGTVDKAIKRSGGITDFWLLSGSLPNETRLYVPAYIAASYLIHYHYDHHLSPQEPEFPNAYAGSDTVMVNGPISFEAIAQNIKVTEEELRFLNPALRQPGIPQTDRQMQLRLPVAEIYSFKQKLSDIYRQTLAPHFGEATANLYADGYETEPMYYSSPLLPGSADEDLPSDDEVNNKIFKKEYTKVSKTHWYIVKKGDKIGTIADRFGCSVAQIKKWNKLKSNWLAAGKKLKVVKNTFIAKDINDPKNAPKAFDPNTQTANSYDAATPKTNEIVDSWADLETINLFNGKKISANEPTSERVAASRINSSDVVEPKPKTKSIVKTETISKQYTVKKGDVLGEIAEKLDCSVTQLKKWNKLKDAQIKAGQKLHYVQIIKKTVWVTEPTPKITQTTTQLGNVRDELAQQDAIENEDWEKVRLMDEKTPAIQAPAITSVATAKEKTSNPTTNKNYIDINDISDLSEINLLDNNLIIGEGDAPPVLSEKTNASAKPKTAAPVFTSYKVKNGDTLWDIIKKFPANTIESLCKLNKIKANQALKVGTLIRVKTKK